MWAGRGGSSGTANGVPYDDTGYVWSLDDMSNRWTKKARPTETGLVLATSHAAYGDYSNTVSAIKSWKFENNVTLQSYAASNTRGFNAKYAGTRAATGSFDGIGGFPPLNPGDRFLFRGFVGPESGSSVIRIDDTDYADISGFVYQIAAIVTSVGINMNYGTFAPIEWSINWQSDWQQNGEELLTLGIPQEDTHLLTNLQKAFGFYDHTDPPCGEAVPSTKCMLVVGEDESADPLSVCLESANLTFNTQTTASPNSCSAGAGGWQSSVIGTTDVQLATTIHGSNYAVFHSEATRAAAETSAAALRGNIRARSRLHYPGIDRYVRIYIGNNDDCHKNGGWEFNKLTIGSYAGLNVDVQSGAIVSFNTTMEFNAFPRLPDGSCEKGYINYRFPDQNRTADIDWIPFVDLRTA